MKPTTLRLDRLLANLGYGSRREVGQMIAAGLVAGDHGRLRDPGERVAITADLPQRLRLALELDAEPAVTLVGAEIIPRGNRVGEDEELGPFAALRVEPVY